MSREKSSVRPRYAKSYNDITSGPETILWACHSSASFLLKEVGAETEAHQRVAGGPDCEMIILADQADGNCATIDPAPARTLALTRTCPCERSGMHSIAIYLHSATKITL